MIFICLLSTCNAHNCSLDSLYQNFTKRLYDQILKLPTAPSLGHKWNLKFLELMVLVPPLQNINLVHSDSVTVTLSLSLSHSKSYWSQSFPLSLSSYHWWLRFWFVGDDNSSIKNDNNFETLFCEILPIPLSPTIRCN